MDLSGRWFLITGASSGIGRETALLLSERGASTILVGRSEERLKQTRAALQGDAHRIAPFDLSATDDIPSWMKTLCAETAPLHGLVHSAGIQQTLGLRSLNNARIEGVMKTNLSSAIMLARGFTQKSCSVSGGSIVFLSSVLGLVGSAGASVYSASKAALIGLTRSLAVELSRDGHRVNCVAPGYVRSAMTDEARESMIPEQFEAIERMHLLGLGTPRDVAGAIAFLLADTGRWVTGTTLVIDGGYSAH